MPKLTCACGELIDYGAIPCPNEWLLLTDEAFDNYVGMVEVEEVYKATKSLLKCPRCSRLHIFWNGFESKPEVYMRE